MFCTCTIRPPRADDLELTSIYIWCCCLNFVSLAALVTGDGDSVNIYIYIYTSIYMSHTVEYIVQQIYTGGQVIINLQFYEEGDYNVSNVLLNV